MSDQPPRFTSVRVDTPLIPFTLDGTRRDGSTWTEDFIATKDVPLGVFAAMGRWQTMKVNDAINQVIAMSVIDEFVQAVLADDDNRKRWSALLDDSDRLVSIQALGEVMTWLGTKVVDRPTGQPLG